MEKCWRVTASSDQAVIRGWWEKYGGCNFGILTDDALVCIDLDVKDGKDGLAELARLEELHNPLPPTHTDRSAGGGQHRFFRKPTAAIVHTVNPLPGCTGVELHGIGGSMILAGTFFPDGRMYKVIDNAYQFAELPAWLLEYAQNGKGKDVQRSTPTVDLPAVWREWIKGNFPEATWNGDEAKVCCPFHDDETPSCSVNVMKQRFYCHASGCHAKGGLATFATQVALKQGVPAPEEALPAIKGVKREKQAERLVRLCGDMELFSCDGVAYATLPVDTHRETWPLRTRTFEDIISHRFYLETDEVPNAESLKAAIGVLRGKALWDGEQIPVHVRLAGDDAHVYLDLGDVAWRCIEVTAAGWRIIDTPSRIRFRRPAGLQELPAPVAGGSLLDLAPFLNCATEADQMLVLAWLVAALRPASRYPVLGLNGEQGSGKSTVARRLRELIDPNLAMLRASPREEDDLLIAAHNGWCINLDNVSHLPPWLSDGICRLSTGAGWAKRQLYTDSEETIFMASRPVLLNGIGDLFSRGDLLDRSIIVTLPAIPESARKLDKCMDIEFTALRPHILGGLLDVVVHAIQWLDKTEVEDLPRMADFAVWACAAAPAMGTDAATFLRGYQENRKLGDQLVIEGSLVAQATMAFMEKEVSGTWRGSAKALLDRLTPEINEETAKGRDWPKTGRGLSAELRRVAPALRKRGIDIQFEPREMDVRPIRINKKGGLAS